MQRLVNISKKIQATYNEQGDSKYKNEKLQVLSSIWKCNFIQ